MNYFRKKLFFHYFLILIFQDFVVCIVCKVCVVFAGQMTWNSLAGICSFEIRINRLCECYSNGQCILGSQCHWTGPTRYPYEGKDPEKIRQ